MGFSSSQLALIGTATAPLYGPPRTTLVEVKGPARRRTVQVKRSVKRSEVQERRVAAGPTAATWIFGGFGLIASLVLLLSKYPLGAFGLALVSGILALVTYRPGRTETTSQDRMVDEFFPEEVEEEGEVRSEERVIPNTRRVSAVGRMVLPFLALPMRDGVVLADASGLGRPLPEPLLEPEDRDALRAVVGSLEELTREVPFLLEGEPAACALSEETAFGEAVALRGLERDLHREYGRLRHELERTRATHFRASLVPAGDPLWSCLHPVQTRHLGVQAFQDARMLAEKMRSRDGERLDEMLRRAARSLSLRQTLVHGARHAALPAGIAPICRMLGYTFHYSAFNFYCPTCTEEIQQDLLARDYSVQGSGENAPLRYAENFRCTWDREARGWRCPSCGRIAQHPIPIHKMLDEVLLPTYDRLMEENKNERLRIYAEVRGQELAYRNTLETEIEQLFQRNRDAIEALEHEARRYQAEIAGEEDAIESLRGVMAQHALTQDAALQGIFEAHRAIVRSVEEGQRSVEHTLAEVFEHERQEMVRVLDACSRAKRLEDQKRDEILQNIAVSARMQVAQQEVMIAQHQRQIEQGDTAIQQREDQVALGREQVQIGHEALSQQRQQIDIAQQSLEEDRGYHKRAVSQREQQNDISYAMAKKAGVDTKPGFFQFDKRLARLGANMTSALIGESEMDSAGRERRALQ